MRETISVWLILEDGKNKGKVALQKRVGTESFPYTCQATWSGKVEIGENVETAIKRECDEELGIEFSSKFSFSGLKAIEDTTMMYKGEIWDRHNYTGETSDEGLGLVKLHGDSYPEFLFIGSQDNFYPVKSEKDPQNNIVLFDDQFEVLKKILNK